MPDAAAAPRRLTTMESLRLVFTSRRTAAVTLQSFFSGLPLGLIWIAVPAWMARAGVDIRTIGLLTLAQTPWTFKFLWSPLMDRYAPPVLERKRGWALTGQAFLLVATIGLAAVASGSPEDAITIGGAELPWVWAVGGLCLLVAFASTIYDIAIDAYAVEVLEPHEHGTASGARTALYRAGMMLAGRIAIWAASFLLWPVTIAALGALSVPALLVTLRSPRAEAPPATPRSLREAVFDPLVGLLAKHRAVEIAAFVVLYKFGDNLSYALVSPFLVQQGYSDLDVGLGNAFTGFFGNAVGALLGGVLTMRLGLGRSLWLFGILQAVSNVGYVWLAGTGPDRPAMYIAMSIENTTSGLGTGAFGVLLLRLTEKRFSATQYALLSSVFALGRVATGPIAGFLVDAIGWRSFFVLTIPAAAPGLIFLQRFVPFGRDDPSFDREAPSPKPPVTRAGLALRGMIGAIGGLAFAASSSAALQALKAYRSAPAEGFPFGGMLGALTRPSGVAGWSELAGVVLFGLLTGLAAAALAAARRGIAKKAD